MGTSGLTKRCVGCDNDFEPWSKSQHPGSAGVRCRPCYNAYCAARPSSKPYTPNARSRGELKFRVTADGRPTGRLWQELRQRVIDEESHCGICSEPVDKSLHGWDRRGPSVDHITPSVLGGAMFDRENLRLTHLGCNARNGNRAKEVAALERVVFARAALWLADRIAA